MCFLLYNVVLNHIKTIIFDSLLYSLLFRDPVFQNLLSALVRTYTYSIYFDCFGVYLAPDGSSHSKCISCFRTQSNRDYYCKYIGVNHASEESSISRKLPKKLNQFETINFDSLVQKVTLRNWLN